MEARAVSQLQGRWLPLAAFAAVEIAIPWWLLPVGEQHVTSSLTAILIASLPLMIALLALRFDQSERVGGLRLVGLFVGLGRRDRAAGGGRRRRGLELFGAACILLVTLCYAIGPLLIRRYFKDLKRDRPLWRRRSASAP